MTQGNLDLLPDAYEMFAASLPEGYPVGHFKPLHPAFVRKGFKLTAGRRPRRYYVDLSIGECNCQKGFAFGYSLERKTSPWYSASYCSHKLAMLSSIVETAEGDERVAMERAYMAALATRYNPFEVVSAFHKEIRRGDFEAAWFWGLVLAQKRKMVGVFKYLINILYEETRDHELGAWLLKCYRDPRAITLSNMSKAISWFCASKKKWQLPHRYAIFEAEMHGYRLLAKSYSPSVAKGSNIIDSAERKKLVGYMEKGLRTNDLVTFQRGVKGLQKLRYADSEGDIQLQEHRYWLYEQLYELAETVWPDTHEGWGIVQYVNDRMATGGLGIGYHELNAIADALAGEPVSGGLLTPDAHKRAVARPAGAIPLGKWPAIPLYAHDNHTWGGKALMRKFSDQLKPNADQVDLDFRWCGAYFGVCYRMVKWKEFGDADTPWVDVKWPTDLYSITQTLWY